MEPNKQELENIRRLVEQMKRAGAQEADAFFQWGRNTEVTARNGEVENLKQAVSKGVGLRVFYEHRLGFGYSSDLTTAGLNNLGERVLALAKETATDENNGLPVADQLQPRTSMPEVFDPAVENLSNEWLVKTAIEMEKASLGYDPRVKTCEEVGAGSYLLRVALANSQGFFEQYQNSYVWIYTEVVAEENGQKQSEWYIDYSTHLAKLRDPAWIARMGAWRAVRMLGARKIETGKMPVVFEPAMSRSLIGNLLEAVNGDLVYKKTSYLMERLGQQIASPLLTLVDDGTLAFRTASRPFDGEGLPTRRQVIVDHGVLKQYLYDTYTARKAGARPTGTAARSYDSLPAIGATNFYAEPGATPAADLLKGIDKGFLVTKMMGRGANVVNGEYSRGANGFYVEKGALKFPVQEVTVSGDMLSMLARIDAVGDDLEWSGGAGAPSLRIQELTVSGR